MAENIPNLEILLSLGNAERIDLVDLGGGGGLGWGSKLVGIHLFLKKT